MTSKINVKKKKRGGSFVTVVTYVCDLTVKVRSFFGQRESLLVPSFSQFSHSSAPFHPLHIHLSIHHSLTLSSAFRHVNCHLFLEQTCLVYHLPSLRSGDKHASTHQYQLTLSLPFILQSSLFPNSTVALRNTAHNHEDLRHLRRPQQCQARQGHCRRQGPCQLWLLPAVKVYR